MPYLYLVDLHVCILGAGAKNIRERILRPYAYVKQYPDYRVNPFYEAGIDNPCDAMQIGQSAPGLCSGFSPETSSNFALLW